MRTSDEVIRIIKTMRKQRKISIDELAKEVGISKSTLSRYENGQREFPINDIGKYAKALNTTIEFLLGIGEGKNQFSVSEYDYIHTSISAGTPLNIEGITKDGIEKIQLPDFIMGKWAGNKDIFLMRVNGESMNNVFSHGSLIAVKKTNLSNLHDGDIVVYSDNEEYAVKRIYIDRENKRFIFKPDSSDKRFFDKVINFDKAENLKIHGKVVLYIVEL